MQPPVIMLFVRTNEHRAAAAARIGARSALRERSALMGALRSCFARTQTWLQAGKYVNALASELPSRNGWSIAEHCGDRSPDCAQRLLNRASWDETAAMSQVRRHAAAGLDGAVRRCRRKRMAVGALDETGQEKQGSCTAGRQAAVPGLRGPGRERHQHGAPVLRPGEDGPRADRRPAVDTGRAGQGPGEVPGHGTSAWTCGSAPRASWPSTS